MKSIFHFAKGGAVRVVVATSLVIPIQAQETGLLISDERYAGLPLLPTYSGAKFNDIPNRVSLKAYCPVAGDQGQSSTCVGWALGYGLLTIQRAVLSNQTDQAFVTRQAHSAAFLFNQLHTARSDCSGGAYIEDGLLLLKEIGCCLESSFNFERYGCAKKPSEEHIFEAQQYRIQDFAAVFDLNEPLKGKVSKACKVLATRTPIVVGMGITKSFFDILPGTRVWDPDPNEPIKGFHAMVLVGYNGVEKYFELFNSFGPSWGQNGFIRLPYDDFERLCRYAYVIVPRAQMPIMTTSIGSSESGQKQEVVRYSELSGEFVFRQPMGFVITDAGEELMYFEEIETVLSAESIGVYRTRRPNFSVGDVFQLVAREVPRGCYVYVFSQSPNGTVNVHFPRKSLPHGSPASASFMLAQTAELVLPDEEHLLQLPEVGKDHLCVLYSYAPLPDFERRLNWVRNAGGDFASAVRAVFKDYLVDSEHVRYAPDRMAFSARVEPAKGQIAVLLVLTVIAE